VEYAVIGLGRFGREVAVTLAKSGHEVLAIDISKKRCVDIYDEVSETAILDATDFKAIKEVGINHFEKVIVGIGGSGEQDIKASILACLNLMELNVKSITAKACSEQHELILKKIGVHTVIQPEKEMGNKIGNRIMRSKILDYIQISDEIRLDEVVIDESRKNLIDKTIGEINLRKRYKVNIICIKRGTELIIPEDGTHVLEGDIVLIVGNNKQMDKFNNKGNN